MVAIYIRCAGSLVSSVMLTLTVCVSGTYAQQIDQDPLAVDLPAPVRDLGEIPFKTRSFTFARIRYSGDPAGFRGDANRWATDWPRADSAFSALIERSTGLSTNDPVDLQLTDPSLDQYPFIYIVEGGSLRLSDEEVASLRDYLLGGGFLMVDDFWGEREWESLAEQFGRVFPGREMIDLQMDHEIFRSLYQIDEKRMLPNIAMLASGDTRGEQGATEAQYYGLFDDTGRLMALLCHNTDFGDAWEHSQNPAYPREVLSEHALPMSLNIVVYALSH